MNALLGDNGIIARAEDAKFIHELGVLKEEIELYKASQIMDGHAESETEEIYPIEKESGIALTMNDLSDEQKAAIPDEVKFMLLNLTQPDLTGGVLPTLGSAEYSKFYKLDPNLVPTARKFGNNGENLYIIVVRGEYKVIDLGGVLYKEVARYMLIPLDGEGVEQYVTVGQNTYKLYGNGKLAVIGELKENSGMTLEEYRATGEAQEFDIKAINEDSRFTDKMNLGASGKEYKEIHFNTGTVYVIDQDNELWAWGKNDFNKLGQGHSYLITEPTRILDGRTEEITGIKAKKVWAGAINTMVLDTFNRLWVCGDNTSGQLGQGNTTTYEKYIQIKKTEEFGEIKNEDFSTIKSVESSTTVLYGMFIVKFENNNVYAVGTNSYGGLGLGDAKAKNRFTKITDPAFANSKKIQTQGSRTIVLENNGDLWAYGYNGGGNVGLGNVDTSPNHKPAEPIARNVTDALMDMTNLWYKTYTEMDGYNLWCIKDNMPVKIISISGKNINVPGGVTIDETTKFGNIDLMLTGKSIYFLKIEGNYGSKVGERSNEIEVIHSPGMRVYKEKFSDGSEKIYVYYHPNITKVRALSQYELRVLNPYIPVSNIKVAFVQGNGNKLNIVSEKGEMFEGISALTPKTASTITGMEEGDKVVKLISSATASYALTEKGALYAKGDATTGMWGLNPSGDLQSMSDYVRIRDESGNSYEVEDVFISNFGRSAVFITKDKKLYWAGSTTYVSLPKAYVTAEAQWNADVASGASKRYIKEQSIYTTVYPKEVNLSGVKSLLEEGDEIVSVELGFVSGAGIQGATTYLQTKNGRIFTSGTMLQNGTNTGGQHMEFVELTIKAGVEVKQIRIMNGLTVAVLKDGTVYGWGPNTYGILGPEYEMGKTYYTPVKLNLPIFIDAVSLGEGFAIFKGRFGEVYGIGRNDYGQLGTGDNIGTSYFVQGKELEK